MGIPRVTAVTPSTQLRYSLTLPAFDISLIASKDGCFVLWNRIIRDYSRRSLSRPLKDKFVALFAIARRAAQLKNDSYVAGLFWKDFPGQLL
jgi:hypothetical protein